MKRVRKQLNEILINSLNTDQINDLARSVDPSFRIQDVSGFGEKIVIPRKVAAECILSYFNTDDSLIRFISFMLSRDGQPASGGVVHLRSPEKLIYLLEERGWIYDSNAEMFRRDQRQKRTSDWGFLQEGGEYYHVFSSIDVVMSSELTRLNIKEDVEATLARLRRFVYEKVEKRNGRIWSWSGDGGIAVFHGEASSVQSVLSMMEILFFLPLFNISQNEMRAETDIRLRIGMHYGTAIYREDVSRITSQDLETAQLVEKHCANPNSIAVTGSIYQSLWPEIRNQFHPIDPYRDMSIHVYDYR